MKALKNKKIRTTRFKRHEEALRDKGFSIICGVDEVGRGPWAGPLVACAAIIKNKHFRLPGFNIRDSKKLLEHQREEVYAKVVKYRSIEYALGWVTASEIDDIGMARASHLVLRRAVMGLKTKVDHVMVDGFKIKGLEFSQENIIKGDQKVYSIALASIIAKVNRDRHMVRLAKKYPEYGFEEHKGYGTKQHQAAIRKYGICPIHRKCFKPILKIVTKKNTCPNKKTKRKVTTERISRQDT